MQTFHEHKNWVLTSCFVREDTWVASVDNDYTLCIWRISDAHCIHRFENSNYFLLLQHSYWLKSGDIECIIVATENSPYEIQVLAVESGKGIFTFTGHTDRIHSVCVSSDGKYLISGSKDGEIRIFVFSEHKELHTF